MNEPSPAPTTTRSAGPARPPLWRAVPRLLVDINEAGQALGVSAETVRRLIQRGELVAVRVGRLLRVEVTALEAFVRASRIGNGW